MIRYQLTQPPVGAGGTAVVHRGVVADDGRVIAVKRPTSAEAREQLRAEAAVLAELRHPNIVGFIGCEERGGEVCLLQEYVDGVDLRRLLAAVGPMPPGVAGYVARAILAGLDYLHGRGFVHRDLAPANVLLALDGSVKLADFGLAKLAGSEPTTARLVRGTLRYLSPEQADGSVVDARSDLFVVGLLLHEMITGEPVFDGVTDGEVLAKVLGARPIVPLTDVCPDTPDVIARVTGRLLERKRSARYVSARAALDALPASPYGRAELDGLLHAESDAADVAAVASSRLGGQPRRRRVPWAVAAVAVVAGLVGAVWRAFLDDEVPATTPTEDVTEPSLDPRHDREVWSNAPPSGLEEATVVTPMHEPGPVEATTASRGTSARELRPAAAPEKEAANRTEQPGPHEPYRAPSRTFHPPPRGVYKAPLKAYYPDVRDDAGTAPPVENPALEPTEPQQE